MTVNDSEALGGNSRVVDCSCKVGSVTTQYSLDDINEELARLWAVEEDDAYSLRDLEELFNTSVLGAAMREAGESPVEGEVENFYRILKGDDASEGSRIEVRNRLERGGVDVDEVTGNFVSHQTIHNHLRNCIGVTYDSETDPETRLQNGRNAVFGLQSRTQTVTRNTLEKLSDADVVELGDVDVFVDIMVSCGDCGRIAPVDEILDEGGCDCQSGD